MVYTRYTRVYHSRLWYNLLSTCWISIKYESEKLRTQIRRSNLKDGRRSWGLGCVLPPKRCLNKTLAPPPPLKFLATCLAVLSQFPYYWTQSHMIRWKAAMEIYFHSHSSIPIPVLLFPLPFSYPRYSHYHSHSHGNLTGPMALGSIVPIPMHISTTHQFQMVSFYASASFDWQET